MQKTLFIFRLTLCPQHFTCIAFKSMSLGEKIDQRIGDWVFPKCAQYTIFSVVLEVGFTALLISHSGMSYRQLQAQSVYLSTALKFRPDSWGRVHKLLFLVRHWSSRTPNPVSRDEPQFGSMFEEDVASWLRRVDTNAIIGDNCTRCRWHLELFRCELEDRSKWRALWNAEDFERQLRVWCQRYLERNLGHSGTKFLTPHKTRGKSKKERKISADGCHSCHSNSRYSQFLPKNKQ